MEKLIEEASHCQDCAPREVFGQKVRHVLERHIRLMQTSTNRGLSRFDFEQYFLENTREVNAYNTRVKRQKNNFSEMEKQRRSEHESQMDEFLRNRTEMCENFVRRLEFSRNFTRYSSHTPLIP